MFPLLGSSQLSARLAKLTDDCRTDARQEAARRAYIDRAAPAAEALIARLISCGHA